jgi:predicted TIM-barrel fold metal-dependent hydrolase
MCRISYLAVFPLICLSLGCIITSMAVRSKCPSVQETGLRRPSVLRDLEARWGRGISNLLSRVPVDRILFGSHFPFFLLEAAVLKLRGSELLPAQVKSITRENAERLLRAF